MHMAQRKMQAGTNPETSSNTGYRDRSLMLGCRIGLDLALLMTRSSRASALLSTQWKW